MPCKHIMCSSSDFFRSTFSGTHNNAEIILIATRIMWCLANCLLCTELHCHQVNKSSSKGTSRCFHIWYSLNSVFRAKIMIRHSNAAFLLHSIALFVHPFVLRPYPNLHRLNLLCPNVIVSFSGVILLCRPCFVQLHDWFLTSSTPNPPFLSSMVFAKWKYGARRFSEIL